MNKVKISKYNKQVNLDNLRPIPSILFSLPAINLESQTLPDPKLNLKMLRPKNPKATKKRVWVGSRNKYKSSTFKTKNRKISNRLIDRRSLWSRARKKRPKAVEGQVSRSRGKEARNIYMLKLRKIMRARPTRISRLNTCKWARQHRRTRISEDPALASNLNFQMQRDISDISAHWTIKRRSEINF